MGGSLFDDDPRWEDPPQRQILTRKNIQVFIIYVVIFAFAFLAVFLGGYLGHNAPFHEALNAGFVGGLGITIVAFLALRGDD